VGRNITEDGHPVYFLGDNGSPYGVKQADGKPCMSAWPFYHDIVKGNLSGYGYMNKFGRNADVGATQETVWGAGGLYPWPTAAEILKVSSSDADDDGDPAGNGAHNIQLYGLDADYALQNETITLNGQASVDTANSYIRVYRAKVLSAGSSNWNEGTISVKDNADVVTLLTIEPKMSQTLMALFTVPAGNTGYILSWYATTGVAKVTSALLCLRPFGQVFQLKRYIEIYQGSYHERFDFPDPIPEKSDIALRAMAAGGGGTLSGGFSLWYESD
jgi:hypothetical protein